MAMSSPGSPDGKTIAYTLYDLANHRTLYAVSPEDGSARELYASYENLGQPKWLPDGSKSRRLSPFGCPPMEGARSN
jgi:Tol biopolymer transport system component